MAKIREKTISKASKKLKLGNPLIIDDGHPIYYDDLTDSQKGFVKIFMDWYHSDKRKKPILRVGGVGGSGKSYTLKYLLSQLRLSDDECYVVGYTGQSVNVLRQNGILAKTIHSTFMRPKEVPLLNDKGDQIYRYGIPLTTTKFVPVKKIPNTIKLVIIDEASFLPESLEKIIQGYNVPILETGDPVQLPPVTGKQCFNMNNLDFFMTDIMRQHADSEIIKLSVAIRNYDPINLKDFGRDVKFLWAQETMEDTFHRFRPFFKGVDTIVAATNKQRTTYTDLYRKEIVKTSSPFPRRGERLICRKNDWSRLIGPYPLTNGTQGEVLQTVGMGDVDSVTNTFTINFKPDYVRDDMYEDLLCDAKFIVAPFGEKDMSYYEKLNPGQKFEYAHVVTTHLSQGGSYDKVLFLDSFNRNAEYHMRLRYTAVTRARKTLYYMLPYSKNYPGWTDLKFGGYRN